MQVRRLICVNLLDCIEISFPNRYQEVLVANGILKKHQPIRVDEGTTESHVTIEWTIPRDQSSGTYKISYHGDYLSDDVITSFTGNSGHFQIVRT